MKIKYKNNLTGFSVTITIKPVAIKIKESTIESSNSEKLLGVTIDSKLSFDDHITNLCRKTSQKLHALSRVANYLNFDKKGFF